LYFHGETEKDYDAFWPEEQISGRETSDSEDVTKGNQQWLSVVTVEERIR
jgi:hypothetical protein